MKFSMNVFSAPAAYVGMILRISVYPLFGASERNRRSSCQAMGNPSVAREDMAPPNATNRSPPRRAYRPAGVRISSGADALVETAARGDSGNAERVDTAGGDCGAGATT